MCRHGKLIFRYGTMNSGKSLQLLATANNFQERNVNFIVLKSSTDTRDENVIHSRALGDRECISIQETTDIYELVTDLNNYSVGSSFGFIKWILVDECQFLTEEQVDELGAVADNYEINIICYGLRTDFQSHLFEGSKRLFEIADTIEEIKSSCSCGGKTIMNARIDQEGNVVVDGDQIMVGGEDKYIALCRACYFSRIDKENYNKY